MDIGQPHFTLYYVIMVKNKLNFKLSSISYMLQDAQVRKASYVLVFASENWEMNKNTVYIDMTMFSLLKKETNYLVTEVSLWLNGIVP